MLKTPLDQESNLRYLDGNASIILSQYEMIRLKIPNKTVPELAWLNVLFNTTELGNPQAAVENTDKDR
jgi:hypothetical protein